MKTYILTLIVGFLAVAISSCGHTHGTGDVHGSGSFSGSVSGSGAFHSH